MTVPITKAISPNQTKVSGKRKIDLIVIHTMEAPEKPETAENIGKGWFGNPKARSSAHYCIDNNSVVQCVELNNVAWAAPNANHNGVQFEHAGYAAQNANGWADDYSKDMLKLSAKVAAPIVIEYDIPIVHLSPAQLRAGKRGFVGHVDVTNGLNGGKGHTDPGTAFPWGWYLSLVAEEVAAIKGEKVVSHPVPVTPVNPISSSLAVDGSLGYGTVRALQQALGTPADGIISEPSLVVMALQRFLNAKGIKDKNGKALAVDGKGLTYNTKDVGPTHTIEALQKYLGTPVDGVISARDSRVVRALQTRLATGGKL